MLVPKLYNWFLNKKLMKKILGLDLGTNSIGWSLVEIDEENQSGKILGIGSRIVPMDTDLLNNLEQGNSISKTANRRQARGARRLKQRYKLRRKRLIDVLKVLNWLPQDFKVGSILPYSKDVLAELKNVFKGEEISQDWAIYYLRQKALTQRIELDELARILLHLNQRRGFKSNRKASNDENRKIQEENSNNEDDAFKNEKRIEIVQVVDIKSTGERYKDKNIFEVILANGLKGNIFRDTMPDWIGQEIELEIRIRKTKNTTSVTFAMPDKTDWVKLKEALAKDISLKGLHIGEYHFQEILKDRNYRVRERIIERDLIKNELEAIWLKQKEFHAELSDTTKQAQIAEILYKHNQEKVNEILANDILYVIKNDIIYYHRPLKSQKSSIGECRFEKKKFIDNTTGKEIVTGYKVAPISSPIFQEFRIWKTISNLKIIAFKKFVNGQLQTDVDETDEYIVPNREKLFDLFDRKEKVSLKDILKELGLKDNHKLNYPEETIFPGNETKHTFRKIFNRFKYDRIDEILSDSAKLHQLWHLVYSVEEEDSIKKSLINKMKLPEDIAFAISKLPPFKLKYASFSSRAISKLLPLMRSGKYWTANSIELGVVTRLNKIINAEFDPNITDKSREELRLYSSIESFHGMPEHLATYAVYGIHSENKIGEPCSKPDDIKIDIKSSSLKNPIVEQMLNETMQVVKDIWRQFGRPDDIRVELARDFKKTASERKKIFDRNNQNRDDKERIKMILRELKIGNPNSLGDIEKLRIAEENAKYTGFDSDKKPIFKKRTEPSTAEIQKYRLWMEQHCISPYTGNIIPLTALYTKEYEVEHIIPRSKYYDDSVQNKVIVEAWANKEKDNYTAMQYIRRGSQLLGKKLLSVDNYITNIENTFNGSKRRNLLSDEIPKGFIERQLNDTRHISRKVLELLQQVTPNVYTSIGSITDELKQKWGVGAIMKELLKERFERLERITGEQLVSYTSGENGERFIQLKGYEKRIDHRHHALDALVIACTSQSHIQYINTLEAQTKDETLKYKFQNLLKSKRTRDFKEPWSGFRSDVFNALDGIIISYRNKVKLIAKPKNIHIKYIQKEDNKWLKTKVNQGKSKTENPWISIRQPLHKETIAGTFFLWEEKSVVIKEAYENIEFIKDARLQIRIRELKSIYGEDFKNLTKHLKEKPLIDSAGNEVIKLVIWQKNEYSKSRVKLDASFDEKKINKLAEYPSPIKMKGLRYTLLNHLAKHGDPKKAFEGEGLEELTKVNGKPVTKVTIYEPIGNKFQIREGQYVEAAKGTNLYFLIYENIETKEREFCTLGLKDVIDCVKFGQPLAERREGYVWFTISPNDLVYVPEEGEDVTKIDWEKDRIRISKRIYKMVSSSKGECHFIPHFISKSLIDTKELGPNNKAERPWSTSGNGFDKDVMIKKSCIKLSVDKLGNVAPWYK